MKSNSALFKSSFSRFHLVVMNKISDILSVRPFLLPSFNTQSIILLQPLHQCTQAFKRVGSYYFANIFTRVSFLKRRPSEVFARVHKLLGDGARVDGVQEVARVGEVGGGGSDGVVVGGGACGQALHCLVGQRVQHLSNKENANRHNPNISYC